MKKHISILQMLMPFVFEGKTYGNLPKIQSRRFWGVGQNGFTAYKTDSEIALEKKQKSEADTKVITEKETELKAIKIDKPEDFTKAFQLYKEIAELKGKNLDEKLIAIEEAQKELKEQKPEVTAEELKAIKDDLDITIKAFDKLQIRMKSGNAPVSNEVKSFDERLAEAMTESKDNYEKFKRKEIKRFELEIKAVGAVSVANVTGTTTWGAQRRNDIVMNPNTMTHVRSLLPVTTAGPGTDYYFMKENGVGEGSIASTSETTAAAAATTQATGLKPQFDVDLVESSVKFEIIAGWMLMSRKAMNNIPGFLSFLQRRLPVKLMDVEDQQLLYGTGTSPQIKGILVSGNFTAGSAAGATPPLVERIINDMSLLEDTYKRLATGIVMRPADY